MVGTTCWKAEVGEAFEDLVEFEEERIGGVIVHLCAASTALFDVFPLVEDSLLDLIVYDAGHKGV